MSTFKQVSEGIEAAAAIRENERRVHSGVLDAKGPVVWLPDPEDGRFGVGWFLFDGEFAAYRKFTNGWDFYPCAILKVDVVKQLVDALG